MNEKTTKELDKAVIFASTIAKALQNTIFNLDSPYHISEEEVMEHTTSFVHAVGNLIPAAIYKQVTGDSEADNLSFNHICNRLVVQYSTGPKEFSEPQGVELVKKGL